MFITLEMSLTVLEKLAPLEPKIRQRRKSLADEIGRAAESIALNVSEAQQLAGLDRADLFLAGCVRRKVPRIVARSDARSFWFGSLSPCCRFRQ